MTFNFEDEDYSVDVNEIFRNAVPDDYVDDLDAMGIKIHELSDVTRFENSEIFLIHNERNDEIVIEINCIEEDEYYVIKDVDVSEDEKNMILSNLNM